MASRFIKHLRQTTPNKTNKENSNVYKLMKEEEWAENQLFPDHPHNRLFSIYDFGIPKTSWEYKQLYKHFIVDIAIRKHNNLNLLALKERVLKNEAQQD